MGTNSPPGGDPHAVVEPDLLSEIQHLERDVAREVGKEDPGAVQRLASLGRAFTPGEDPSGWAGVDVVRALNPESVSRVIRGRNLKSKSLGEMERIRNMLALAPVLLTWAGLWYAAASYQIVTEKNSDLLSVPFLLLWEQGFPGGVTLLGLPLGWLFSLSHIAIFDISILAVMLLLTWQIHLEINVRQARREEVAQALQRRIEHVGWRASLELARRTTPQVGVDSFRTASDELLDEMKAWNTEIQSLTGARMEQSRDLAQATANFREVASQLNGMAGTAAASFETMTDIVSQLSDRIISLERQQLSVESALSDITTVLNNNATAIQHGLDQHAASIETGLTANAAAIHASLDSNASSIQAGINHYASAVEAGVREFSSTARQFQESAGRAVTATEAVAASTTRIEDVLTQHQAATAQQLGDGADRIAVAAAAVAANVGGLERALSAHQSAVERQLHEGAGQIAAATDEVAGSIGRIERVVSALERRVAEEGRSYDAAVAAAERAAQGLEEASQATARLVRGVEGAASAASGIAAPLGAIEVRMQDLTDELTQSSNTMARAVGTFSEGAVSARDTLNTTADDLADVARRLSELMRELQKQAEEGGIAVTVRKPPWWDLLGQIRGSADGAERSGRSARSGRSGRGGGTG